MSAIVLMPVLFIAVTLVGTIIQIRRMKRPPTRTQVIGILLDWGCLVIIGAGGIWAFIGHTVFADMVAASIGWPAGNPFQQEVALANLAIAVLGILSVWYTEKFRLAALTTYAIFMMGAGIGHIWQIITVHNMAVNNAGLVLWLDLGMPLVLWGLYLFNHHLASHEANPSLG